MIWLCLVSSTPALGDEIVDFDGNSVKAIGADGRVVSLAPAITETLFHIGAGPQIVGRTDHCNFPDAATQVPSMGSLFPPNLEAIIRAKPDVVIMTSGSMQLKEKLRALKIPVFVAHTQTLDGIGEQIRRLGVLTGRQIIADKKASLFQKEVDAIRKAMPTNRPRIYWEIWTTPLMTTGKTGFVHDIIKTAGGMNVFGDQSEAWPTVTRETVVRRKPDIIFTVDRKELMNKRKSWVNMMGIPADRVIHIKNADIIHRPTPRVLDGLKWVASTLRELK
jgi:iron complex transport system substrate-binding protein